MAIKRWNASASQWELVGTPGTATPSAIGAASIGNTNTFSSGQIIRPSSGTALEIISLSGVEPFIISRAVNPSGMILRCFNGTYESPTAIIANQRTAFLISSMYGTSSYANNGGISIYAAENQTDTARGSYITFETTASGTVTRTERMRIDASGNLGLGISTLSTHNPDLAYNKTFALTQSDQTLTFGSYWQGGVGQSSFINSSQASSRSAASPLFIQTGGLTRLAFDNSGNIQMTNQAVDTLRYFDIYNTSSGNSAGTIIRMITNNAANSGVTTVDMVKYRNGYFGILNNDSAGVTGFGTAGSERMRIDAAGKMSLSAISRDTSSQVRNITLSTSSASGGNDGDVWLTYTA